jgi:hypothetical protein
MRRSETTETRRWRELSTLNRYTSTGSPQNGLPKKCGGLPPNRCLSGSPKTGYPKNAVACPPIGIYSGSPIRASTTSGRTTR